MSWNPRLLLSAAIAALAFTTVSAQHGAGTQSGKPMMTGQQHQAMLAKMEASQKRLDELVTKMQAASGQAKVDQLAVIVAELVAQQRQMHTHMASHHGDAAATAPAPAAPSTPAPSAPAAPGAPGHVHE